MKKSLIVAAIFIACFMLFACKNSAGTTPETNQVTITYDGNGGSFLVPFSEAYPDKVGTSMDTGGDVWVTSRNKSYTTTNGTASFTIPDAATLKLSRTGFTFLGWSMTKTSDSPEIKAGSSWQAQTNYTVYAIWAEGYEATVGTISNVLSSSPTGSRITITGNITASDLDTIATAFKSSAISSKLFILDLTKADAVAALSTRLQNITTIKGIVLKGDTSIYAESFFGCTKLESIEVLEGNTMGYKTIDGVLYIGTTTLAIFPPGKAGDRNNKANTPDSYTVLAGVTTISESAFCKNSLILDIYLPVSIKIIYQNAFKDCENLIGISSSSDDISTWKWNIGNDTTEVSKSYSEWATYVKAGSPKLTKIN